MNPMEGDPGASLLSGGLLSLLDRYDHWLQKKGALLSLPSTCIPTSRGLLLALLALLLLLVLPPVVDSLLRRIKRQEANFRGEAILQSYGLLILLTAAILLAADAWLFPSLRIERMRWLVCLLGFGALGWLDDGWGSKKIKGLRGHFRAAFRERTITTGFIKAVGGALLALGLGWSISPTSLPLALLHGVVIALSANAMNLLDLRPGRAGGCFLLLAALLLAARFQHEADQTSILPLLYIVLPALFVWKRDSAAQVMMGDTGSNMLGAYLGLSVALMQNLWISGVALLLLIALHLATERLSLTRLIENTSWLRSLDRLTGVR